MKVRIVGQRQPQRLAILIDEIVDDRAEQFVLIREIAPQSGLGAPQQGRDGGHACPAIAGFKESLTRRRHDMLASEVFLVGHLLLHQTVLGGIIPIDKRGAEGHAPTCTMQYGYSSLRTLLPCLALILVPGCATLPPAPAGATPKALRLDLSAALPKDEQGQFPTDFWWTAYNDPALNALMDEALAQSPDIALAAARLSAADALAAQAGGAFLPSLTLEGATGGTKQSYNMGIPAEFVPKGVLSTGRVAANLGFNLDLWGRNRAALAAARGDAAAAFVDAAQARLVLTTGLATAWIELSQIETARDIAARSSTRRTETLNLTLAREKSGIDGASDVALARSRTEAARAELAALNEMVTLARHRIAALIGAGPERGATFPRPVVQASKAQALPNQLGVALLGRRPDLVAVRLRAEAALNRTKAAKRDFYPNINLTALAGLQSLGLGNLLENGSTMANFGPAISLPIFANGRITAQYRGAQAGYAEAVARYDQTLLAALRETADTIASRQALDAQLAHMRASAAAAEDSAHLARQRYQQGIANLLQVNTAEDTALAAQRSLADLEARSLILDVALIRALGGGFRDAQNPTQQARP